MNSNSLIKLTLVSSALLLANVGFASETASSPDYSLDASKLPQSAQSQGPEEQPQEDDSFLPFFGKEAREKGYDLPKPYGINVNYMTIHQNIDVKSIRFDGLSLPKSTRAFRPIRPTRPGIGKPGLGNVPSLSDLFKIDVKSTRQSSHTELLRLDAWVFPFMNVYGVVGHTKGKSTSKVDVGSSIPVVNAIIKGIGDMDNVDFKLKFKGTTYGLGTTLAGGVGNWFGLVDVNFTRTQLNIIDGNIKAFTLAPRVGYRFTLPGFEALKLPQSKLSIWTGAMYQKVDQTFRGKLSNLSFSPKLQRLIDSVNSTNAGRFEVKQEMESPWNMLAGFRWEVTPSFNVVAEAGFIKRNSFFAAIEYRF